jgi:enoyl-CoA hydratase
MSDTSSPPTVNVPPLLLAEEGAVRVITLNRPAEMNAADGPLHEALGSVWSTVAADAEARVVVLTGAGRAFSAGGDFGQMVDAQQSAQARRQQLDQARHLIEAMVSFPLPVIAAVNGPAVGLGCSLAMLSDLVLIDESTYLADPHLAVGLVPGDGAALVWPLMMGLMRAKEYAFTGARIPADRAVELGIATRAVPAGTVVPEAMDLARQLAALPPAALQDTKRFLNLYLRRALDVTVDPALAAEGDSIESPEHRDLVARMMERARDR